MDIVNLNALSDTLGQVGQLLCWYGGDVHIPQVHGLQLSNVVSVGLCQGSVGGEGSGAGQLKQGGMVPVPGPGLRYLQ